MGGYIIDAIRLLERGEERSKRLKFLVVFLTFSSKRNLFVVYVRKNRGKETIYIYIFFPSESSNRFKTFQAEKLELQKIIIIIIPFDRK